MVIVNAWQSGIGRNMLTISGNLGKPPTDLEVGWATILLAFWFDLAFVLAYNHNVQACFQHSGLMMNSGKKDIFESYEVGERGNTMRSDVGLWCWMMTTQRLLQFHSTWLMATQCSILLNSAPRSAELPLPCKDSAKLGPALHERTTSHDDGQGQGNAIIRGYEDGLRHGRTLGKY